MSAATGQPVADAIVGIQNLLDTKSLVTHVTGQDEVFIFDRLACGKYHLMASAPRFGRKGYEQHGDYV